MSLLLSTENSSTSVSFHLCWCPVANHQGFLCLHHPLPPVVLFCWCGHWFLKGVDVSWCFSCAHSALRDSARNWAAWLRPDCVALSFSYRHLFPPTFRCASKGAMALISQAVNNRTFVRLLIHRDAINWKLLYKTILIVIGESAEICCAASSRDEYFGIK